MGKRTVIVFYLTIVMYVAGVVAGCIYQVKINDQAEMYEYLKNGVSEYSESIITGIKATIKDNFPELLILLVSAYLPFGTYIVGGVLAVRGFLNGFVITAVMRVFGFLGATLCVGNLLSAVITVPCFIGYAGFICSNGEAMGKVRLGIFCLLFLTIVLFADGIVKGGLSSVILRLWN